MDEQDVKIAVLEREVAGLREQHKDHKTEMVNSLNKLTDAVFDAIKTLREDVKDIYEFINKSKGYVVAMMLVCSVVGGSVAAILPVIITHYWK
jgi:hypothetical protein